MSFLGGAECSTAGNPLSQFTKHIQDDKSLQRDRLVNKGPAGTSGGFRSLGMNTPQAETGNDFKDYLFGRHDQAQGPFMPLDPAQLIPLDHMRPHSASPTWDDNFQLNAPSQFSPDEFAAFRRQLNSSTSTTRSSPMPPTAAESSQQQQQQPPQHHRPMMDMGMMGGMSHGMMSRPMFQPMYSASRLHPQQQHYYQQEPEGKGKGRVVELDDHQWEEQFAQIDLQDKKSKSENLAMEPELDEMDEKLMHSETGAGDLEAIWRGIQAEQAALRGLDMEDEDEEFAKFDDANLDNLGAWDMGLNRDRMSEEYLFEEDNIFDSHSDPFEEGLLIMSEGGNLSLAALAFEAAVRKDPTHVNAWVQLGTAQAQNEKEEAAIRALERAQKIDPNNLTALMGLSVSYVNEGYDSTAYRTLERWLSVKYPNIISPDKLTPIREVGFTSREELHDRVTKAFIEAAQLAPDGEHMDPDVQVGLGVLFYGVEDFGKAVDCFKAALHSSELGTSNHHTQRHLLWNRLGATLANSGRSEDAIVAYEKALELQPNFVRARYNLGVSCVNIGCHSEAAGHLLSALSLQKQVEKQGREKARQILRDASGADVNEGKLDDLMVQNASTTLYDTLRRVFAQMGRRDLAEKVVVGVDPDIFRGEFDF